MTVYVNFWQLCSFHPHFTAPSYRLYKFHFIQEITFFTGGYIDG